MALASNIQTVLYILSQQEDISQNVNLLSEKIIQFL